MLALATFLLVYSPHYRYAFPSHIDEWHHITEVHKLQKGEYHGGVTGYRIGFQIVLLLVASLTDLIKIYKYLPASWAVVSGLVLFYVVYNKTGKRFLPAILAMLFFASIKSNVNITGLWFFTPLSFSIPFIYLYVYFFTEGLEKENKTYILVSLAIMLMLVFVHSISVLFAVPFLAIYSLCNFRHLKSQRRFFLSFLLVPVTGAVFYKYMTRIPWNTLIGHLFNALQFKYGWGVLEIKNSFFEMYSFVGYLLAFLGILLVFGTKERREKYLAYGLWPVSVLLMIIYYRLKGVSYLSPYQRNLYYFAIAMPFLSALGLEWILDAVKRGIENLRLGERQKIVSSVIRCIIVIFVAVSAFLLYWYIPKQIDLYEVIDEDDYEAFMFLKTLPESTVMATPRISTALYPITGHKPVATYFFYGNRPDAERFFRSPSCEVKNRILKKYSVKYVLSKMQIQCGWRLIYDKGNYIYAID